ncbi:FAD:protein FMN transferase [Microbulbifer flavimaris]|uniref:FAD:protein FMN transferase n=1 Tax=Microbulbifer flavimaris TaxID=1781068 RepID=A0ABX4I270_9GAMM|nr:MULTISPECIES: FAD:protein FMN transferase [Microbulbifer]KUJ83818.1 thiamine biosynthesis protein ApbE [Microbulbifer sp. ZGT114]PCO05995.1 FAD:protein FMN transferase [Microbulbifer flavimaris]
MFVFCLKRRIAAALSVVLCMVAATGAQAEWHYEKQPIMGTEVSVQLWHEDAARAEKLIDQVVAEFRRLDKALSPYKPDSELSRVNRLAGKQPVQLSEELAALIDKSLWYSHQTDGAFDISYATLGRLYDFRGGKQAGQAATEALLEALNYRNLQFDPEAGTLRFAYPETQIDLGGIAKGYAVDRAIAILARAGITNASVSAGGDARMLGDRRGKPWLVGIRHPRDRSRNAAVIPLNDTAISTSGDYERFFISDDQARVHHIFDPSTGHPTETGAADSDKLISVSVIGPHGFDTDPLSTSVFVLGKRKGLALIERLPGFEAVVIDSNRKLFFSSGLGQPGEARPDRGTGSGSK